MAAHPRAAGRAAAALLAVLAVLGGCGESDAPDDKIQPVHAPEVRRVLPAEEAIAGAQLPTLDPVTLVEAEIADAIGTGPRCEFRYTGAGGPVVAMSMAGDGEATRGVVGLNGNLVLLEPAQDDAGGRQAAFRLRAGPIRAAVAPDPDDQAEELKGARRREADMVFEIGDSLRAGYRGYLDCIAEPPMRPARP
jgi:hypothetical protein